jgi:hypothetical protein
VDAKQWDSRGHFFAAAAEAMRRILIENARRKGRIKRRGELHRQDLDDNAAAVSPETPTTCSHWTTHSPSLPRKTLTWQSSSNYATSAA